jgi:hypothetical protein
MRGQRRGITKGLPQHQPESFVVFFGAGAKKKSAEVVI